MPRITSRARAHQYGPALVGPCEIHSVWVNSQVRLEPLHLELTRPSGRILTCASFWYLHTYEQGCPGNDEVSDISDSHASLRTDHHVGGSVRSEVLAHRTGVVWSLSVFLCHSLTTGSVQHVTVTGQECHGEFHGMTLGSTQTEKQRGDRSRRDPWSVDVELRLMASRSAWISLWQSS